MHVDLLPSNIRVKVQVRTAIRRWARTWAILVAVVGVYCCIPLTTLITARNAQTEIAARSEPLNEIEAEIIDTRRLVARLTNEKRELEKLNGVDHTLDLLNVLVQAAKTSNGHIQLQKLGISIAKSKTPVTPSRRGAPTPPVAASSDAESSISLQGVAEGDSTLSTFVDSLRKSNVFKRVDLRSTSQIQSGYLTLQQYQLECRLGAQP